MATTKTTARTKRAKPPSGMAAKARTEDRTRIRAATLNLPDSVMQWAADEARARRVKLTTVLSQLVASGVFRLAASRSYASSAKGRAAVARRRAEGRA